MGFVMSMKPIKKVYNFRDMAVSSLTRKIIIFIIALVAWFGLSLQFYLIYDNAMRNDIPLAGEVLRFFSYFTILTNLLVAIALSNMLRRPGSRVGKFFASAGTQTAIALYIGVVGLVYSVALRHIWNPTGWQLVADRVMHDMVPIFYILYWAFLAPKERLPWTNAFWWLLYPAIYCIYVLIRGAVVQVYPYHFIDKNLLTWPQLLINIAILMVVFLGLGLMIIALNRLFIRKTSS